MITPSLQLGGAERSLVKLVQVIWPGITHIHVICLSGADKTLRSKLPPEAGISLLNGYASSNPFTWIQVYSKLRLLKPDLVLGWSTYANLVAVTTTRCLPGSKVVLSERNYVPKMFSARDNSSVRRKMVLGLMRRLYRKADVVTANSLVNLRFLKKYIGPGPVYRLLPNVIDLDEVKPKAECAVPALLQQIQGPRILAVGRLVYQKGFDLLLDALRRVRTSHPWSLVIVGDGPLKSQLMRQAQCLGLTNHVHWAGLAENPFPFYRWAQMVVVPSRFEGFPNVALEAMAMGRAVICSDCDTGPRELTVNGKFGRLVPTGDSKALADAILELGRDPDLMDRMGGAAQGHVRKHYEPNALRERYLEALGIR